MSWSRFAHLLRTQPLDPETKLMLINMLNGITDPKLEEEFFTFVFAWEEAQASTQKKLMDGISDLTNQYQQAKNQLNATEQKRTLSIADDLQKQKHIHVLRGLINTL
ncbi:MAG: hypothetical protein UT30_C0006G0037 [Candidatus Uhrbacteria bacterium GW2011_GWF2_39_13]|uniref:Uncharacterized protein n=1 Tax=Candidatus Uhrbacteria bacterium GW2011_GWF2_39_13 TaxID=1618995 RepID=A0A0G0MN59_9BACT|nr:MAG: hypothetical protein UT30_C0006G0037 [Candidatus Uhrbacteria bacterium GW2011_GWF2_39_13]